MREDMNNDDTSIKSHSQSMVDKMGDRVFEAGTSGSPQTAR